MTPEDKYKEDFERLNRAGEEKRKRRMENVGILRTIRRETLSKPRSSGYIGNPFRDQPTGAMSGSPDTGKT